MLLYKINGGEYIVEIKFKVIDNNKKEDLREVRKCMFGDIILFLQIAGIIYVIIGICIFLYEFIKFKSIYGDYTYPFHKDIYLVIATVCVGILTWRTPVNILKEPREVNEKYKNDNCIELSVYFYETCIKTESILGNKSLEYSNIKKVYETDTKFIFRFKDKGYTFVSKDSFVIGDSNSFREFLKNKIDNKATKYIIK